MRWILFDGIRLEAQAGQRARLAAGTSGVRCICALVVALAVVLALGTTSASAESLCTDTWTGPSEGSWTTSGDWSSGVPTSSSVACIGAGKTVKITSGTNQTGVVQGEGTLVVSGGTLDVVSTLEESSIKTLQVTGGTVTGSSELNVSGSLSWSGGTMSGSGSTVVSSGASGTIDGCLPTLIERTLTNDGTTNFTGKGSEILMEDGAHLANKGVFEANAEPVCDSSEISIRAHKVTGEPEPVIVNTGTFKKTEGTGTTDIAAPFENHGTVEAAAGALELTDGGSGNSEGKWAGSSGSSLNLKAGTFALTGGVLEGAVQIVGATITAAGSIEGSASNLTVSSGTFTAESGSSTSVGTFKMSGGTINGSGNLSVSSSFSWSKGTMSGTGSTVVSFRGIGDDRWLSPDVD